MEETLHKFIQVNGYILIRTETGWWLRIAADSRPTSKPAINITIKLIRAIADALDDSMWDFNENG